CWGKWVVWREKTPASEVEGLSPSKMFPRFQAGRKDFPKKKTTFFTFFHKKAYFLKNQRL
ncbi:MAG: hypothetical protein K2O09_01570, partial [Treponemataceae bacterium]|nr:hypothetical protein [Treponemataceae bacterium]